MLLDIGSIAGILKIRGSKDCPGENSRIQSMEMNRRREKQREEERK